MSQVKPTSLVKAPSMSKEMEPAPEKLVLTKKKAEDTHTQTSPSDSPTSTIISHISSPTIISTNKEREARRIWIRKTIEEYRKLSVEELTGKCRKAGYWSMFLILFTFMCSY